MLYEVVAIRFGEHNTVTNDPKKVLAVIELNVPFAPVIRDVCNLMAKMDLGQHWKNLADGPTLFLFDTETEECLPPYETQTRLEEPDGAQPVMGTADEDTV